MTPNLLAKSLVLVLGITMAACGGGGGGSTPSDPGPTTYTLTVARSGVGAGKVTGGGLNCPSLCTVTVASGTSVTLTASITPDTGSTFAGWDGTCSGTGTCTVAMTGDKTVTANFGSLGNALTIARAGTGSGSVASTTPGIDCGIVCLAYYPSGSVTLTATPALGATFAGWSGGGCDGTGACVVSMTAAQTVTANFAAGDTYASPSAGCNKTATIPSSQINTGTPIAITAAGRARRYILSVPTTYDNTRPYRLVVAFHEFNGNDKKMYANGYYHLLPLSGDSTIFVAPNGQLDDGTPCTEMGSGQANCGWFNKNPADSDLALADEVVAQVMANFCVDMNHIFVTGFSFGAGMSYYTSCQRPEGGSASWFVRGAALYSGGLLNGTLNGTCTPTKPVAYYASHGNNDDRVSFDMGVEIFKNFAGANSCTYEAPIKVTSGNHVCTVLSGCTTGYPTAFCAFAGGHNPDPNDGGKSWEYPTAWNFLSQL